MLDEPADDHVRIGAFPAAVVRGSVARVGGVRDLVPVLLLALAGFLAGGSYTSWKSSRLLAALLAAAAALALAGGIAWWI